MANTWHSLYLPIESFPDAAAGATALGEALGRQGYQRYDPFAGGTGTPVSLKEFVKCLVAPPLEGWLRILGDPANAVAVMQSVAADLSAGRAILWARFSGDDSGI